ncbi:MAG TPA: IS5 family transposase [Salinimicrobium sp.]|nr:IS5 family transposase [Salinimicrobium sp.]
MDLFDFRTGFENRLNPDNRWVKFSKLIDWDKIAGLYSKSFPSNRGAGTIDARIVVGALIIKHIEGKDDRGTVEAIQENPYMQYFLGLKEFSHKPVFDPSLFVHIRKRFGQEAFDKLNQSIIQQANKDIEKEAEKEDDQDEQENKGTPSNKGKLQLDATACEADISYPTDLGLLNDAREKSEELIDLLYKKLELKKKPRTYRRIARKKFLNLSKNKRNSKRQIRRGIREQLGFVKRNIKSIDRLLEKNPEALGSFKKKGRYKYWLVIQHLYQQQKEMYDQKSHSTGNRIVSIHQPHIRPIVRGKKKSKVEFGPKINVSLDNGYARIDQFSFEAFNESSYLKDQIESYKRLHGYYPELVQTDNIYMTRENRAFLKENNIRHTGKALGRSPKKENVNRAQARKLRRERAERNHIEGKFGQGKRKYGLGPILARLEQTQQSWVAASFFVMNIIRMSKESFLLILEWLIFGQIPRQSQLNLIRI